MAPARRKRAASKKASSSSPGTKPFCSNLPRTLPELPANVLADSRRARAILNTKSKWVNGTVLHYCFFGGGSHYAVPKKQADAVREAFAKWKAVGIGLDFQEVTQLSEAEVRIGYSRGLSGSFLDRDFGAKSDEFFHRLRNRCATGFPGRRILQKRDLHEARSN